MIYKINEVINYGGFFAGDTVTVTAHEAGKPGDEVTLTIDQGALTNLDDRFQILADMALDVQLEGGHVVAAALVATPERAALRDIVKPKQAAHAGPAANGETQAANDIGPQLFSHYCAQCKLWILGAPHNGKCGVEGHELSEAG